MERYNDIVETHSFWIVMEIMCAICIILFLLSPKKKNKVNEPLFSSDNSNFIKGVSAIGLIFHHYSQIIPTFSEVGELVRDISSAIGFVFSAVFLFVSGYGLEKKTRITYIDIKKRILRLVVPYFFLGFLTAVMTSEKNVIKKVFTFFIINNGEMLDGKWFIVAILYFNITFMIIKNKYKNSKIVILLNVLFLFTWIKVGQLINVGYWWYNTSACFLLGVLIAKYENKWRNCIVKSPVFYWISIIVMGMMFIFFTYLGGYKKKWFAIEIASITGVIVIYGLCNKRDIKSPFITKYIAQNTLELYMLQSVILTLLYENGFCKTGSQVLWIGLLVIVVAHILGTINRKIMGFLLKRRIK